MSATVERTDSIGKGGLVAVEPVKRTLALAGVLLALLIIGAITRPDIFLDPAKFWATS
jgi:hypothetical protein